MKQTHGARCEDVEKKSLVSLHLRQAYHVENICDLRMRANISRMHLYIELHSNYYPYNEVRVPFVLNYIINVQFILFMLPDLGGSFLTQGP